MKFFYVLLFNSLMSNCWAQWNQYNCSGNSIGYNGSDPVISQTVQAINSNLTTICPPGYPNNWCFNLQIQFTSGIGTANGCQNLLQTIASQLNITYLQNMVVYNCG